MVRIQSVLLECLQCILIDHILKFRITILLIPSFNLLNLMRSTKTIEEVDEWNMALQSRCMSNWSQIHYFLYGRFTEHCYTSLAASIYIRMITKNVQCMSCYTTCRYIEYTWKSLTSNLIQIRCGISCSKCTSCKRSVNGTCGTCLGLHLGDLYSLSEHILTSGCCPFVCCLRHYR